MRQMVNDQAGWKFEEKVVEIHEKRENRVITLYNEIYIFTSVYITNACSKWVHHDRDGK